MSLVYSGTNNIKVNVTQGINGKVHFLFTSDCGKFGTDEILDEFEIDTLELLRKCQEARDNV